MIFHAGRPRSVSAPRSFIYINYLVPYVKRKPGGGFDFKAPDAIISAMETGKCISLEYQPFITTARPA